MRLILPIVLLAATLSLGSSMALGSVSKPATKAANHAPASSQLSLPDRLNRLEKVTFGTVHSGTLPQRLTLLETQILGSISHEAILVNRVNTLEKASGINSASSAKPSGAEAKNPAATERGFSAPSSAKPDVAAILADAVTAYDKKQIEKARDLFEQVVALDGNNVDANFSLGLIAEDRGDFAGAQKYYQRASNQKPDDQEIADALKNIKTKIAQTPSATSVADDVTRATSEFRAGHYTAAKAALQNILKVKPNNDRAHFALAECLKHLQDRSGALAHFKEALRLSPDNPIYKSEYAKFSAGRDNDVIARDPSRPIGGIVPFGSNPEVVSRRIDNVSFEARNLVSQARSIVARVLNAERTQNQEQIAQTNYELTNFAKKAPNPQAEMIDNVTSYHLRGAREVKEGLLGDALADYRKGFSANPWDAQETLDLVRLEIQNQDWSMAEQHCLAAILLKPTLTDNWLDLGLILLHKQDFDNSLACFTKADSLSGTSGVSTAFLNQAISATSDPRLRDVLNKAAAQSQKAHRLSAIGIKTLPGPEQVDANLNAYKSDLLLQLADKWHSDSSGIVLVATVDRTGKVISVEALKSSSNADSNDQAVQLVKQLTLPALPGWYTGDQRMFVLNFDKVKTLANTH